MKKLNFKNKVLAMLVVFTSLPVIAGTVVDDLFNVMSFGEYHKEYEKAQAEANRDIARENRILQENIKSIDLNRASSLLNLYKKQYELSALNLASSNKLINTHVAMIKHLEKALEARLNADTNLNLSKDELEDAKKTYDLLTNVDLVPLNRDYLKKVQETWWSSMEELNELCREKNQSASNYLDNMYGKLDANSLDALYISMTNFSSNLSPLIAYYDSQKMKFAHLYNTQLYVTQNLGSKLKLKKLPIK